jgi:hypothetical protein
MKLAFVSAKGRGETDRLLSLAAARLIEGGSRVRGIVKVLEAETAAGNDCDMPVRVLPDGPVIRITQSLGEGSQGCRLNPGAIAESVAAVEQRGLQETDLFVLNKFGPEEASGRGFCAVIGAALEAGIPVLVGVGGASLEAFDTFAGGLAESLPPDIDKVCDWCRSDG